MKSKNVVWQDGLVSSHTRQQVLGHNPLTIWMTGLSGSGKSTLAFGLEQRLLECGYLAYVLDGDNLRHGLSSDLGFSPEDRHENIRRVAQVSHLMNEAGVIVIASFISPYRADRQQALNIIGHRRFFELYLSTPLSVCEGRDVKGLYKKARNGEMQNFTGVDAPYELPESPAFAIDTSTMSVGAAVAEVFARVQPRVSVGGNG